LPVCAGCNSSDVLYFGKLPRSTRSLAIGEVDQYGLAETGVAKIWLAMAGIAGAVKAEMEKAVVAEDGAEMAENGLTVAVGAAGMAGAVEAAGMAKDVEAAGMAGDVEAAGMAGDVEAAGMAADVVAWAGLTGDVVIEEWDVEAGVAMVVVDGMEGMFADIAVVQWIWD